MFPLLCFCNRENTEVQGLHSVVTTKHTFKPTLLHLCVSACRIYIVWLYSHNEEKAGHRHTQNTNTLSDRWYHSPCCVNLVYILRPLEVPELTVLAVLMYT